MDELDSYSRTVSAVAAQVTPRVAAVRIGRGSGGLLRPRLDDPAVRSGGQASRMACVLGFPLSVALCDAAD